MSNYQLHLGDCLEFMRTLDAGGVDAVITDPPYGVDWDTDYTRFTSGFNVPRSSKERIANDDVEFDPRPFLGFKTVVLFGANCFSNILQRGTWFVWDKRFSNGTAFLADGEVAWMNRGHGVYIKSVTYQGFVRPEKIYHPTQKPVEIMRWIIDRASNQGDTIFDPFMGSGTTGVACMQLGRNFIGCEIDPTYYAIAERRIADAAAQPVLFALDSDEVKPEQAALL